MDMAKLTQLYSWSLLEISLYILATLPKIKELGGKQSRSLFIMEENKDIPYSQFYCMESKIITKQGCTCFRLVTVVWRTVDFDRIRLQVCTCMSDVGQLLRSFSPTKGSILFTKLILNED